MVPFDFASLSRVFLSVAIAALAGSTILLGTALLLTCSRRAASSFKHRVWGLSLVALLIWPALWWGLPKWSVAYWPQFMPATRDTIPLTTRQAQLAPLLPGESADVHGPATEVTTFTNRAGRAAASDAVAALPPEGSPNRAGEMLPDPAAASTDYGTWISKGLFSLWLLGVAGLLARAVWGQFQLRRVTRAAANVELPDWQADLSELKQQLGLAQVVTLRSHPACSIPCTWGARRPVILLPAAALAWSSEVRRTALMHELVHIARRDVAFQNLAQVVCLLYWFQPLVWWANRRLRIECEHACDDAVLGQGTRASDYAQRLLEIARECQLLSEPSRLPGQCLVAMSQGTQLEQRLVALFDEQRGHSVLPGRHAWMLAVSVTSILLLITLVGPSSASDPAANAADRDVVTVPAATRSRRTGSIGNAGLTENTSLAQTATPAATPGDVPGAGPAETQPDRELLTVTIRDQATQQPVAGARIVLRYYDDGLSLQEKRADATGREIPLASRTAESNAAGQFVLPFPPQCAGRNIMLEREVWHPDYVVSRSFGSWELSPRILGNTDRLKVLEKVELKAGRQVTGRVLQPDGTPAMGVPIHVATEYPEYLGREPLTMTDADGRYSVRVPDRDHRIFVLPNDYVGVSFVVGRNYGKQRDVRLETGVRIQGRLLDADGRPVAGVVLQGNGGDSLYHGNETPLLKVRSDQSGRFDFPPVSTVRDVDVRVDERGYWGAWMVRGLPLTDVYVPQLVTQSTLQQAAQTASQQPATIQLEFKPVPTVTLTLRYLDAAGQPRNSANIEFFGIPPGPRAYRWRGYFRKVLDQPGTYSLKVPRGLTNAAIDLWQDPIGDNAKVVATRLAGPGAPDPQARVEARYDRIDRDDDSIELQDKP